MLTLLKYGFHRSNTKQRRALSVSALSVMVMIGMVSPIRDYGCAATPRVEITRERQTTLNATVTVGQSIVLLTAPAPLTAYRWEAQIPASGVVALSRPPYYESEGNELPGGLQKTRFDLLAMYPGEVDVKFYLFAGPKLNVGSAVDRFVLHITVQKARSSVEPAPV